MTPLVTWRGDPRPHLILLQGSSSPSDSHSPPCPVPAPSSPVALLLWDDQSPLGSVSFQEMEPEHTLPCMLGVGVGVVYTLLGQLAFFLVEALYDLPHRALG